MDGRPDESSDESFDDGWRWLRNEHPAGTQQHLINRIPGGCINLPRDISVTRLRKSRKKQFLITVDNPDMVCPTRSGTRNPK